ncbi:signal peptidase I [Chakrabartyella piscis]|uniref:signal peptidase I n=1 Tax=Chakrabartyella piscis TaxID=2918914 RepID=UPI002958C69B|nr:signal peptidase I [Chakrabartyella piscis]
MFLGNQWKEWKKAIPRACGILCILFLLCWPVHIDGVSMEPTLSDGNLVFMSRSSAYVGKLEQGDIAVFETVQDGTEFILIKRIIAVGGDHLYISPEGEVWCNGELVEETYAIGETDAFVDMTIPEGTVFVMGDHRDASFDSRHMGVIPEEDIKGKVIFKLYPLGEICIF